MAAYYTRRSVLLQAEVPSTDELKTLTLDCYEPRAYKKLPVILLLPILGGKRTAESMFAEYLANNGFVVVILERPYTDLITSGTRINDMLVQELRDCRSVLDWIQTHRKWDANRIGILGISLGGIIGTLLAAIDPRIRASIFALAGAKIWKILRDTTEGTFRGHGLAKRRKAYLIENKMTLIDFEADLVNTIHLDPLFLARRVRSENILQVQARYDRIIHYEYQRCLGCSLGEPETIVLRSGHFLSMCFIPYLCFAFAEFFRRKMDIQ